MILIGLLIVAVLVVVGVVGVLGGVEAALPVAAFVCILFPVPCRISMGGMFELTTQRLVLLMLLILFFVRPSLGPPLAAKKRVPLLLLMGAQVGWALISTANSIVPGASIKKLLGEVLEYYCLYFICVKSITSVRTVHRILYAMVGALAVCSIFGACEAYLHWRVLSLFPKGEGRIAQALGLEGGGGGGICATFPHRILFGAALAVAIVLALYLLQTAETKSARIFLWVAVLLMFMNIYKAMSRGPWLGLILAFALMLVLERRRVFKYHLIIGALALTVLIARPGVWRTIRSLYGATFDVSWSNPKGLSAEYRFELRRVAQAALAKDFKRMLWGYGMESFVDLQLEGELAGHAFPFLSCDSAWIELALETGYVGLLLIAVLLLVPAYMAWRDFRRLPDPARYLSLSIFISLVIYYFMMLGVAMYAWGQEGYMLWMLIASSVAYGRLQECEGVKPKPAMASLPVPAWSR